jgi:hypothetical protein
MKPKMNVEIVTITPELAASWLKLNVRNRPITKANITFLVAEMLSGRFQFNGGTIVFDEHGRLMDGQHRLMACIQSGVPFDALVVRGVPEAAFSTIDQGQKRIAGDIVGGTSSKSVAAVLKGVHQYLSGAILKSRPRTSLVEIERFHLLHPGVRESFNFCLPAKRVARHSAIASMHYLFSHIDRDAADEFVTRLATGENLQKGSPLYTLRERLLNVTTAKGSLRADYVVIFLIKAWNAHRSNETLDVLKFAPGKESVPLIRDLPASLYDTIVSK